MRGVFFKILIAAISISCFLTSCDSKESTDGKHPVFVKAENSYNEGKTQEAWNYYQKYLQLNPHSAKASYRLASIAQDNKDYVKAIYYYEKYLALDPNSGDKEIIQTWIEASKKSLVKEISKEIQMPEPQKADTSASLDTQIVKLKQENEQLQKQLQALKENKAAQTTDSAPANDQAPKVIASPKIYVVEEGDSLYRISQKMYGSNKYYRLIIEANKDKLKGGTSIKLGDKLIIPPLKTNE